MNGKDNKIFNLEEAYKHFVKNAIRRNKERAELITPDSMYEQYSKRRKIISAIDDLCFTFEDNLGPLSSIFEYTIIKRSGDNERQKEDIDMLFTLIANFIILIGNKDEINKWRTEFKEANEVLDKMEVYNLNAGDIVIDNKFLKKINKKLKKNSRETEETNN